MRAVVVLPTPRTPVRIQACGMRPLSNALETVRTIASWPIRSSKVAGRYLRASTRYGAAAAGPVRGPRSSPGKDVASFIARALGASASSSLPGLGSAIQTGFGELRGRMAARPSRAWRIKMEWEADERPEPELVRAASFRT